LRIRFFNDHIIYRLKNKKKKYKWICVCISDEGFIPGEINIILTNDKKLKKLNQQFLQRNSYTDIITFDSSYDNIIEGELYISMEAIRRNSKLFNCSASDELDRVIIHGILHMMGYKDKTGREEKEMRAAEEKFLALRVG
jgi:probable rRNA maturation factor